jgi:hypothetical protein
MGLSLIFLCLAVFLLFLTFNLAILGFIFFLDFIGFNLVYLILAFEAVLGGLVNISPHITNNFSDLSYLRSWIVSFHTIVDFSSIKEKCREGSFRSGRLHEIFFTF